MNRTLKQYIKNHIAHFHDCMEFEDYDDAIAFVDRGRKAFPNWKHLDKEFPIYYHTQVEKLIELKPSTRFVVLFGYEEDAAQ